MLCDSESELTRLAVRLWWLPGQIVLHLGRWHNRDLNLKPNRVPLATMTISESTVNRPLLAASGLHSDSGPLRYAL